MFNWRWITLTFLTVLLSFLTFVVIGLPHPAKADDATLIPTLTPTLTRTITPTPSITQTLGAIVTQTPAPRGLCPSKKPSTESINFNSDSFFIPDDPYDLAPDLLLKYLNLHGSVDGLTPLLEEAVYEFHGELTDTKLFQRIQILSADVTNDTVPDILMSFTFTDQGGAALFVFMCEKGSYRLILNGQYDDVSREMEPYPYTREPHETWDGIRKVQDLNANGVADIVFANLANIAVHSYGDRYYSILEWNGSDFTNLAEGDGLISGNIDALTIRPHGNGTYELAITDLPAKDSHYGGAEAQRKAETVYAWNGVVFTRLCRRFIEPAKYRVDAVLDGDRESNCRNYDQAMRAYQQAIFASDLLPWNNLQTGSNGDCCLWIDPTLTPDPTEPDSLEAYARYRIILLHVVRNRLMEAKTDYDILQTKFPPDAVGHQFAELAGAFWTAYQKEPKLSIACNAAVDYAGTHSEILKSFARYTYFGELREFTWPAFELSNSLKQICPFD